jgi:hypothetical protein
MNSIKFKFFREVNKAGRCGFDMQLDKKCNRCSKLAGTSQDEFRKKDVKVEAGGKWPRWCLEAILFLAGVET